MDVQIACDRIPFRWKEGLYNITDAGIRDGKPHATVNPECQELVDELCLRLARDRGLVVYLGDGFVCFPEDF